MEARTGFGGGYCDRQDVEYIERGESDDEFDDVRWGAREAGVAVSVGKGFWCLLCTVNSRW